MRITLRQLEVFAAVARLENVSQAARALAMSQSAASSAILELERQYDCSLFDRAGKSLHLNAMGKGLLPQARETLARATEMERYLAGAALGPVSIGATLTIGNYLGTLIVAEYLQRHPDSRADFSVRNTAHIVDGLLNYDLDLGLIEGDVSHPDLLLEPWLEDELVVFCAPRHPLASRQAQPLEKLAEEHWIVREPGSGTRNLFNRAMASRGITPPIRLQLEHTEAIKRAVECGLGLGCLSRLALREAFRRGSLVEIATPDLDLHRRFHFARHRNRHITAATAAFLDLSREFCGDAKDTGSLALPYIV